MRVKEEIFLLEKETKINGITSLSGRKKCFFFRKEEGTFLKLINRSFSLDKEGILMKSTKKFLFKK